METFSALLANCAGIHWSPVNSPHKGQWRGALMFSFICVRLNGWVNNCKAGDFRRYRAHYDVTIIIRLFLVCSFILGYVIIILTVKFETTSLSSWKEIFKSILTESGTKLNQTVALCNAYSYILPILVVTALSVFKGFANVKSCKINDCTAIFVDIFFIIMLPWNSLSGVKIMNKEI